MILRKKLLQALSILGMCSVIIAGGCASGEDSSSKLKEDAAQEEKADQEILDAGGSEASDGGSLGEFSMEDVNGETYTQEMFADHDLTMINVFTTWCSPCIREIPDLEKLSKEMEDQGVQVVGIVLDVAGNADEETIEKAKLLAEKTGAAYPFLIPDAGYLNGRLAGISAVPETFFADKEGNIVGKTYSGSRSFEDWKGIVEKELEGVRQ
ncbi:TlpA disulfide reductase family protein [Sporofaciens sp. JLR.KK001]|jgi:thiol-disulfide isomerase/thioredoxin|uniref:TlpA family protein disulfide reductase n=1 Tax=Sporofaciens sp. JLR.KK001 TaxID=3112621 RepID=UPI002FEF4A53